MSMTSQELRDKFLSYFESKGHKRLPSASLVPADDISVLFTTAGMQQFRRFYADHNSAPAPAIVTSQKCLRTSDIDEVGDSSHLTFFEMLGNFTFSYPEKERSYFKKEAIECAWEFLTEVLKIEKARIHATYFKDDASGIEEDKESLEILQKIEGLKKIEPQDFSENFWSLGTENSPGGPTVEFYVDSVELWNLVFNQYVMQGGKYIPSKYRGVDTGMGLERLTAVMSGKSDIYEIDLLWPLVQKIEKISGEKYQDHQKEFRIIADHLKAATFLLEEGIVFSNKDRGYIARRLIRRAIVKANEIGIKENFTTKIAAKVFEIYQGNFKTKNIIEELEKEENKFRKNLEAGLKEISHIKESEITGKLLFDLYQSYGLPKEIVLEEIAKKRGQKDYKLFLKDTVRISDEFTSEFKKHQDLSRTASAGMFKGGLADASEKTIKLHTAAHLMLAALREIYGPDTNQRGSNINAERLRFDFNHNEKMTPEEITKVEEIVNKNIAADLPVTMEEMSIEEAKKSGVTGIFDDRYGDKVKVYTIGLTPSTRQARSGSRDFISREICGGPHVDRTGKLGHFKIIKEESSSAGVRRIKAIFE